MKKRILYILFLLVGFSTFAQENILTNEGNEYYRNQEFEKADSLYKLALEEVDSFIPAMYNHGMALYKLNKFDEAISQFTLLTTKTNDSLVADCYFNMANANLKKWYKKEAHLGLVKMNLDELANEQPSMTEGKMEIYLLTDSLLKLQKTLLTEKKEILQFSIDNYKNCLRKNPNDNDARYNLLYTYKLKPIPPAKKDKEEHKKDEEKKGASKYALDIKEKALKLIEENKFSEAHKLMQSASVQDETMKEFNKMMQKLEVIAKIKEK